MLEDDLFLLEDFLKDTYCDDLFGSMFEDFDPQDTFGSAFSKTTSHNDQLYEAQYSVDEPVNKLLQPVHHPVQAPHDDDIRLKYPKKIEIAMNSHDRKTVFNTYSSICTADVTTILYYPKGNPHGASYREMHGVEVIADFFSTFLQSAPDSLFLMHSSRLIPNINGTTKSQLVCKFTISGSKIFSLVVNNAEGVAQNPSPGVKRLQSTLDKLQPKLSSQNLNTMDNARQPITLHETNKFDRYKKIKGDTVGTFVNYSSFKESNLLKHTEAKKIAAENKMNVSNSSNSSTQQQTAYGTAAIAVAQAEAAEISEKAVKSELNLDNERTKYKKNDIMIGDKNTVTFSHSALLPLPVNLELYGLWRYFMNEDHKIYRIEGLSAHKNIKIRSSSAK